MILFGVFIIGWITSNAILLSNRSLDPYPFLLLNIILSCLAAVQAPVIMMSQNRQEAREKKQQEILVEKDIVDFKQDRLDLILDQKEWEILKDMYKRIKNIEAKLAAKDKNSSKKKK